RFKSVLEQCEIEFALLPNTKDVWAADYMPIQTDLDKFVRFIYDPPYLKGVKKYQKTISDADAICKRNDQANGDYINYLEMDSGVVIPTFGFKEDEEVVRQFESIFSGKKIMTLDSNDIANEGGVLNCITWNIK